MHLKIGCSLKRPRKDKGCGPNDTSQITLDIVPAAGKAKVDGHLGKALLQALGSRVINTVGRGVGVKVVGRNGGPHEKVLTSVVGAAQDSRGDGIEKRLCKFGLFMVCEQHDVGFFNLRPGTLIHGNRGRLRH